MALGRGASRPEYEIAGRTALITGAARGIGAATARRLHARGANVALVGLEPDLLAALADELGERALPFEADVTDIRALERGVAATVERFGGLDIAIANAGIANGGTLMSAPVEAVERTFEVNLMGVWRTNRAVLPELVKRRGYVLNVASLAAASHAPLLGPYSATKAGVEALSDSLRGEMLPRGVAVGCAYFGFIDTDLVRSGRAAASARVMDGELPRALRRPIPVDAAAAAIERGIGRRAPRVWAPWFVGPVLALRGVLQPLSERRLARSEALPEAIRLAEDPPEGDPAMVTTDPLMDERAD